MHTFVCAHTHAHTLQQVLQHGQFSTFHCHSAAHVIPVSITIAVYMTAFLGTTGVSKPDVIAAVHRDTLSLNREHGLGLRGASKGASTAAVTEVNSQKARPSKTPELPPEVILPPCMFKQHVRCCASR